MADTLPLKETAKIAARTRWPADDACRLMNAALHRAHPDRIDKLISARVAKVGQHG